MAIIWTVEDPRIQIYGVTERLMMNYPVRRVASIGSFAKLLEMEVLERYPNLVIVNDAATEDSMAIFAFCKLLQKMKHLFLSVVTEASSERWVNIAVQNQLTRVNLNLDNDLSFKLAIDNLCNFCPDPNDTLTASVTGRRNDKIEFGDVVFERLSGGLAVHGHPREVLSPKEIRILEILCANLNSCVSRKTITDQVWPRVRVSNRTLDSHISRLRGKLTASVECSLESVYGQGYQLKSD